MRKAIALVGVVAAAAIVIVALRCRSRGAQDESPNHASEHASTAHARGSATDPRRLPHGSIAGTVRDERGAPIAQARVCADSMRWLDLGPACAASAADGSYVITDLVQSRYEVAASAPKYRVGVYRPGGDRYRGSFVLRAGETRTGIGVVLRGDAVELAGTVLDLTGGSIAKAIVRVGTEDHSIERPGAWSPPVVADDHGAFSVWVAPGDVRVRASADGYAPTELDATAPDRIAIVLTPEASIAGIVIDERGRPVEGADVTAHAIDVSEHARSDERGQFRIEHLVPERYAVEARADGAYGRSPGSVFVGFASNVKDLTITVHAAFRVTGRVTIGEAPCAEPDVVLHDVAHDREVHLDAGDDGWVHGDALQRGTYAVHPSCAGGVAGDIAPIVLDRDRDGLAWKLTAGATLRGHVRDATNTPVEGASVDSRSDGVRAFVDDTTARDGSFELRGLPAATYEIEASAPIGTAHATRTIGASDATLELVLSPGAKVAGIVVGRSGAAMPHVRVGASGDHPGSATTRGDGRFEILLPVPGAFDVVATAGEFSMLEGPHPKEHVILSAGDTLDVRLVVDDRTAKITGTVTDAGGTAVADAYVAAYMPGMFGTFFWSFTDHHPTLTDPNGHFTIDNLAQNRTYTVHAYRKGGGETLASDVAAGTSVALVLPRTSSLAGTVRFGVGAALDLFDLEARNKQDAVVRDEIFDHTNGTFALDELPAGHYVISVATPDAFAVDEVTIAPGEHRTGVALVLDRMVPVTGRLVDAAKHPVSGVTVVATNTRGGRGTVSTPDDPNISGPDGRFTVLAPRGETRIATVHGMGPAAYCTAAMIKTITAAIDLGDIVVTACGR